ncbi:transmembrane sensor [Caulobacter segnis]|nr:transmembrane sensor [Caulobacter segnis]
MIRIQRETGVEETRQALQDWLSLDPEHRLAFQQVTETWEFLPGAAALMSPTQSASARSSRGFAPRRSAIRPAFAGLGLAACVLAAIGVITIKGGPVYVTEEGQHRAMTLADGSRLTLNTDSRAKVIYSATERRIRLDRGEAAFDVAHDPAHPFVVVAGTTEVRALGTAFVVRRQGDRVSVTLVRGKVEVSGAGADSRGAKRVLAILTPGQRLRVAPQAQPQLDTPPIEMVTAWEQGEVIFEGATLAEAANEMNRYGPIKVTVDADVSDLRISGVFATNQAAEFATAAAQLHGLKVVHREDGLDLRR